MKLNGSTLFFYVLLAIILLYANGQVYNVNISCGTCAKTTGCIGNMCIFFIGDIQQQFCLGNATCTQNVNQTYTLGKCNSDFSGSICQSGMCALASQLNTCITADSCFDGTQFFQTCQNGLINSTMWGGPLGNNTLNSTYDSNQSCTYKNATGIYSTCSGDSLGNTCNCCLRMTMEGMTEVLGSCVPTDSPIYQAKSSMNFEFQTLFSVILLVLQILFITH